MSVIKSGVLSFADTYTYDGYVYSATKTVIATNTIITIKRTYQETEEEGELTVLSDNYIAGWEIIINNGKASGYLVIFNANSSEGSDYKISSENAYYGYVIHTYHGDDDLTKREYHKNYSGVIWAYQKNNSLYVYGSTYNSANIYITDYSVNTGAVIHNQISYSTLITYGSLSLYSAYATVEDYFLTNGLLVPIYSGDDFIEECLSEKTLVKEFGGDRVSIPVQWYTDYQTEPYEDTFEITVT